MSSKPKFKNLKLSGYEKLNPNGYKLRLWPITREFRRWGKQEYDRFVDERVAVGETRGNENDHDLHAPGMLYDSEFDQSIEIWDMHPWYRVPFNPEEVSEENDNSNSLSSAEKESNLLYKGMSYFYNCETGETSWTSPCQEWQFALESWGHFTPRKSIKLQVKPFGAKYSTIFDRDSFFRIEDWRLRESQEMSRERKMKEAKAAIVINQEKKRRETNPTPREAIEDVMTSLVQNVEKNLSKKANRQLVSNYFKKRNDQYWHPSTMAVLMAPLPLGGQCEILSSSNKWVPKRLITDMTIPSEAKVLHGGYVVQDKTSIATKIKKERMAGNEEIKNNLNKGSHHHDQENSVAAAIHLSLILRCAMPPHVEYRERKTKEGIKVKAIPRRDKYLKSLQAKIASVLSISTKSLILEECSPYEEEISFSSRNRTNQVNNLERECSESNKKESGRGRNIISRVSPPATNQTNSIDIDLGLQTSTSSSSLSSSCQKQIVENSNEHINEKEYLLPNYKNLFVTPPKVSNIKKRMGLLGNGKQEFFHNFRERKNRFRFHMTQAAANTRPIPCYSNQDVFINKIPKLPLNMEKDILIFDFDKEKKNEVPLSTTNNDSISDAGCLKSKWPRRLYKIRFVVLNSLKQKQKPVNKNKYFEDDHFRQLLYLADLKAKIEKILLFLASKGNGNSLAQLNFSAQLDLLKSILRMEIKVLGTPMTFNTWEGFWAFHINPIFFGYSTLTKLKKHHLNLVSQLQNPKYKRIIGIRDHDSDINYDEEEKKKINLNKELNSSKYATSKNVVHSAYAHIMNCSEIEHLKPKWGKYEIGQWIDEVEEEKRQKFLIKQGNKDSAAEIKKERQLVGKRRTEIRKFFVGKILKLEEEKRLLSKQQGKQSKQSSTTESIATETEIKVSDPTLQNLSFHQRVKEIRNRKVEQDLKQDKFFEFIFNKSNPKNEDFVFRERIINTFVATIEAIDKAQAHVPASMKEKKTLEVPYDKDTEICYDVIKNEKVVSALIDYPYQPKNGDCTCINREQFLDFMKCSIAFHIQLEKIKKAEELEEEMKRQKLEKMRRKQEKKNKTFSSKEDESAMEKSTAFLKKIRPAHSHIYLTKHLGLDNLGKEREELYCAICRRERTEKSILEIMTVENSTIIDFDIGVEELKDSLFPIAVTKTAEIFQPPLDQNQEVVKVVDNILEKIDENSKNHIQNNEGIARKRMNQGQKQKLMKFSATYIEEYAQKKREYLFQEKLREEKERQNMVKEEVEGRIVSERSLILLERPSLLHQERSFKFYNGLLNQLPTVDPSLERMSWVQTLSGPSASTFVYHVRDRVCNKEYIVRIIGIEADQAEEAERILKESRQLMTMEAHMGVTKVTRALKHKILNFSIDGFISRDMNYILINEEYCALGRAVDVARKKLLSADLMYNLTKDLVTGLSNLHEAGIFHRELTPSCIYLNEKYQAKIGSFRLWTQPDILRYSLTEDNRKDYGTEWILPPDYSFSNPSEASCDVWALGCCLFSIATGGLFPEVEDIPLGILNKIPCNYAQEVRDVIIACLQVTSRLRPAAEKLKKIFDPLAKFRKTKR